jgi:U3 small nucleolar RNA-associated protein 3
MLDDSKWGSEQKRVDYMSASDEEILPLEGLSEEDEESEDTEMSDGQDDDRSMDAEEQEQEDLNNEGWGSSRKIYYGADDVSDEEDVAQEEQEAERLQKKHLARLRPEDFLDTWTEAPVANTSTQLEGYILLVVF